MGSQIVLAITAVTLIVASATPVPLDHNRKPGTIAFVRMEEPSPVAVALPPQQAQKRQFNGDITGGLQNTIMSVPPMYTSPYFGGKMPFEYISGPYQSNSLFGQPFQGGPFGGLGVPLSNGPLGGIMSIPLLYMMG